MRLPEADLPTPDHHVPFQGQDFFVEVKALHVRRGEANNAAITEAGFRSLLHLLEQRERHVAFAIAEMRIQPHAPSAGLYDPSSAKYIAESLLARIDGRFGVAQFGYGPTFGAVDLTMLPVLGTLAQSTFRTYAEPKTRAAVTGVLWSRKRWEPLT